MYKRDITTGASFAAETKNLEIPILKPKLHYVTQEREGNTSMGPTDEQKSAVGQRQLENFLYENESLKEDVHALRGKIHR